MENKILKPMIYQKHKKINVLFNKCVVIMLDMEVCEWHGEYAVKSYFYW